MTAIKLCLSLALLALSARAGAAETPRPSPTVVMPAATVKPCTVRPLVQGSGNVRVCPGGQL